jgi:hypothetical protein
MSANPKPTLIIEYDLHQVTKLLQIAAFTRKHPEWASPPGALTASGITVISGGGFTWQPK